ncbi:lipid-binding SYLF domain-containing protein [Pedobacter nutrimenti]|jgi:lipid-binding SYLF domain-containing protein|uniref:Lipid-binding SYLF domain-containing protein n=1 Tax=Pedobacter nutrimenti TaxID=1241337 RepID=A0A318UDX1_9SPHI|nr:lipid-binding SYLF domain-containing protein [Pedobacter nutrimenti]PYF74411.1 lipid-binding SYLF domain-containing protein [Pedobacter nutrimenti]
MKNPNFLNIKKSALLFFAALFMAFSVSAQSSEEKKIGDATVVLSDFAKMKESIPAELLEVTQGIIIVPKLINAGFVVGGKRGKGVAMVKKADGSWSNPVFVTMTGGSIGFQIGVQAVDLVLVFKHSNSLTDIKKSSFTLGGDLSVAAGPVGRNSTASTDYKLDAEVYSYSRSKGLFAGISLNGAALAIDEKANKELYGKTMTANEIFNAPNSSSAVIKELKSTLSGMK